jgi:hypothetical protein
MALLPDFVDLLDPVEQDSFLSMRETLFKSVKGCRHAFDSVLLALRRFAGAGPSEAWKLSLVCGVAWPPPGPFLAVNVDRLRHVLNLGKSSIYGKLGGIGYITASQDQERLVEALGAYFPAVATSELRQWTFRVRPADLPPGLPLCVN